MVTLLCFFLFPIRIFRCCFQLCIRRRFVGLSLVVCLVPSRCTPHLVLSIRSCPMCFVPFPSLYRRLPMAVVRFFCAGPFLVSAVVLSLFLGVVPVSLFVFLVVSLRCFAFFLPFTIPFRALFPHRSLCFCLLAFFPFFAFSFFLPSCPFSLCVSLVPLFSYLLSCIVSHALLIVFSSFCCSSPVSFMLRLLSTILLCVFLPMPCSDLVASPYNMFIIHTLIFSYFLFHCTIFLSTIARYISASLQLSSTILDYFPFQANLLIYTA